MDYNFYLSDQRVKFILFFSVVKDRGAHLPEIQSIPGGHALRHAAERQRAHQQAFFCCWEIRSPRAKTTRIHAR